MIDALTPRAPLQILIVDDEALARARMRALLQQISPPVLVQADVANAVQAMEILQGQWVNVVLVDIHMPGADGLILARSLRELEHPPALIFVTAHAQHAVQAFELEAVDYLTKPVRLERLQVALQKAQRTLCAQESMQTAYAQQEALIIQERGRTERVALDQVLYFKAELKYLTVRTANHKYILDASLNELEEKYRDRYVRVHRNALIARRAVRALEKHFDTQEGEGWMVRLHGVPDLLAVSRRQLPMVRGLVTSA